MIVDAPLKKVTWPDDPEPVIAEADPKSLIQTILPDASAVSFPELVNPEQLYVESCRAEPIVREAPMPLLPVTCNL